MSQSAIEVKKAQKRRRAKIFGVGAVVVLISFVALMMLVEEERLDHLGCPIESGPSRDVIVVLDISDPLSQKHQAEIQRILREMIQPGANARHASLAVKTGERVSFYLLQGDKVMDAPIEQRCNPGGNPMERTATDALTTGSVITEWRWQEFANSIDGWFPEEEGPPLETSPILTTIAVVAARHAPSQRMDQGIEPAHLIVISDLLENNEAFSHYSQYPTPADIPREFMADLSRVNVSLFRLERSKYQQFQTPAHFYWWTDYVEAMGGTVAWQQTL